jgi:hypothetical protein
MLYVFTIDASKVSQARYLHIRRTCQLQDLGITRDRGSYKKVLMCYAMNTLTIESIQHNSHCAKVCFYGDISSMLHGAHESIRYPSMGQTLLNGNGQTGTAPGRQKDSQTNREWLDYYQY